MMTRDRTEHETPKGAYRVRHEWDGTVRMSTAVVQAVASALGRDPTELEAVGETIDPDALDTLFHPKWVDQDRSDGAHVVFGFAGCEVTVTRDGTITVNPQTSAPPP